MLEAYRKHVAERAELGTVPLPLNEKQVAELVELLKNPPAGEDAFLMDLLENRIPAGVDQAAYVKAAFLAAIVKGEATSPLISKKKAVEILGTMQGGYNVQPLVAALDDAEVAQEAADALNKFKYEVASEVGVNLKDGYNGDISARDAGRIGGNMVKKLIQQAESQMK